LTGAAKPKVGSSREASSETRILGGDSEQQGEVDQEDLEEDEMDDI